jgi:UDP-N-acetylmuramoylalanine--D-glutamate ligase
VLLAADGPAGRNSVVVVDRSASVALDDLASAGAEVVVADPPPLSLLDGIDEVIVSPGVAPHHSLAAAAVAAGIDVYSEPELAWRLRGPDAPPWLAITGTNGKTTTVTMVASILRAAGSRTEALGNIGVPLVTLSPGEFDVLAVELSSFQIHWSSQLAPPIAAILNLADDHLEWHLTFDAYAGAKFEIWRAANAGAGLAIGNLDDARVAEALGKVSGDTIGFTLGRPKPGEFGVEDGWLVDHAGAAPIRLIEAARIRPAGTHNVANALAAAAITRAYGVSVEAVRDGLANYVPEPHRNAPVADVAGVHYVDDSKATNPHAASGSLLAYPSIVWIAGGQLKGVDVNDLVATVAARLRGAVLLGVDRAEIAAALARHAPEVPVVDVANTDDEAMSIAVRAAAALAETGDTVLLAPAAASKDMFTSYAARGNAFADAVGALPA